MQVSRRLIRDKEGAAAIEFGLMAMPFFTLLFAILEVAFMFFIDSSLDAALQMTARQVRTGKASTENWNLATFKSKVCANMSLAFDCENKLLVKTTAMADFSSVSYVSAVKGGKMSVEESFSAGESGDYMLIQAFLPFDSVLAFAGVDAHTLDDGSYALAASALFRNEPFE